VEPRDTNPMFNRQAQPLRDLNELVDWLEYGKTSGFIAARESKEQEEHWAQLLGTLMAEVICLRAIVYEAGDPLGDDS
jgi:hypothetical protein